MKRFVVSTKIEKGSFVLLLKLQSGLDVNATFPRDNKAIGRGWLNQRAVCPAHLFVKT